MEEIRPGISDYYFRYASWMEPEGWWAMYEKLLNYVSRVQKPDSQKMKAVDWI